MYLALRLLVFGSQMHPLELFTMLNELYSGFDLLVEKHGVSKVETIGDAYFVIGGAPDRTVRGKVAAKNVVRKPKSCRSVCSVCIHQCVHSFARNLVDAMFARADNPPALPPLTGGFCA